MTKTENTACNAPIEVLTAIANEHLDIETLQPQNRDQLDFYDCAVWTIQKALEAAFRAGYKAGQGSAIPASVTQRTIATLSLDDLSEAGFETRFITPAELQSLAADLADHYIAEHFWSDLEHFAETKDLPRI